MSAAAMDLRAALDVLRRTVGAATSSSVDG